MNDTERLEWIAEHVYKITIITTLTGESGIVRCTITWLNDEGWRKWTRRQGKSYVEALRNAVDVAMEGTKR